MEGSRGARAVRVPGGVDYAAALARAVAGSPLSRVLGPARSDVVACGVRLDVPARTITYREGDAPFTGVVVRGVLRVFITSADGREFTLFWARAGEWLGYSLVAGGPMDVSAQALTDTTVHVLPVDSLRALVRSNAEAAWELSRQTAARLAQATELVRMLAFMDLRQRMAQRLLEVAFRQPAGAALVAAVSQQELADSVGSPRTSVARVLADLRREGLVRSVTGGVEILRPERLAPGIASLIVA